jgi:O-antigen/teichoic acid export membrane protein
MTSSGNEPLDHPEKLGRPERIRFLARDVTFYGAASVLNKGFFLITLPLLARHFDVKTYGVIDFLNTLVLFLATITVLGQDSAVARYFWDDRSLERRRQVVSQSLAVQLGIAATATALLIVLVDRVPLLDGAGPNTEILLQLVALHLPFMVLMNFAQGLLKWTFSRRAFATVTLGQTALNATLLIAAIVWFDADIVAVFAISLASRASFGIIGLIYCRFWLTRPTNADALLPLLAFGVPFGAIGAIGTFVPVLERGVVGSSLGAEELGMYAAGAIVALIITLPIQAFQMGWGPFSLAIHHEPDADQTYNQVLKGFALLTCLGVIALSATAPFLVGLLAGDPFAGGAVVVMPLALALAIQGVSWVTEIGITLSKRTYLQLYAYAAFLLVAAFSMAILGTAAGLVGVATGVLLGYTAKAVVASSLAQRAAPMSWAYGDVVSLVAATALLAASVAALHALWGPWVGLIAGAGALTSLVTMGWLWLFAPIERTRVLELVRRARSATRPHPG